MSRGKRLAIAGTASTAISLAGWRARALAPSGAVTATVVGTSILGRLSWPGGVLLGAFFVSSSLLSRLSPEQEIAARGGQRDMIQVLANGGVAAATAMACDRRALLTVAASLAAATADTWATEIGATSSARPRLIVSRRPVVAGTSGAVTTRGLSGALAGAGLLGLTTVAVSKTWPHAWRNGGVVLLAGMAGSLMDSVLGELVQERRWCPRCEKPTEAKVHRCGESTVVVGGWPGISNDVVNVLCTFSGALVGGTLGR